MLNWFREKCIKLYCWYYTGMLEFQEHFKKEMEKRKQRGS